MKRRVALGRIAGAHGLRGEVRALHFGDSPDNLLRSVHVWLAAKDATVQDRYALVSGRAGRPGEVRLSFEGIDDRDAAQRLRGHLIWVAAEDLEAPGEDEYYWHQLVGCSVETSDGVAVGTVLELWETGAHDVLVIEGEGGRTQLVPTAREFVTEIDLEARRIVVEAIPGLLELPTETPD